MAWNVLITGAAALLGLAGIGLAAQEPEFDYQVAAPTDDVGQLALASYQKQSGVSVRFHDAKVGEVLNWLEREGVSFVVADPSLKNHTITLNVENQPVDDVADAIASSLGGHWDRKGKIRIYHKGAAGWSWGSGLGEYGNGQFFNYMPKSGTFQFKGLEAPKSGELKDFELYTLPNKSGQDFKVKEWDPKTYGELFKNDGKDFAKLYSFGANHFDFDKFYNSLTEKQRDLMKSQGYLKLDDLTSEQRDMIGLKGDAGTVEIEYSKNGKSVRIKSK